MKTNTNFLTTTALMCVLIIVGRYITIPLQPVPLTFQAFFVLLSGAIFGRKVGASASALYLALGLIGIPIFTGGGGIGYVLKPTFGYLVGFIAGGYFIGYLKERYKVDSFLGYALITALGHLPIYALGTLYFYFINLYLLGTPQAFMHVVYLFILTPLPNGFICCALIGLVAPRLSRALVKR